MDIIVISPFIIIIGHLAEIYNQIMLLKMNVIMVY